MSVLYPWMIRGRAAGAATERWCAVEIPVPATETSTLIAALRLDARWCEQLSAQPELSRRDRARLRRLARRLRREIAALSPKPGRC